MEVRSLDELVELARHGDIDAFSQIYDQFRPGVVRYLFHHTSDAHTAEDLAQQVFLKVWENIPRYEHRGRFKAWLYRVARNLLFDYYRTHRPTLDVDGMDIGEPCEAERHLVAAESYDVLRRALDRLPDHYREVIIMRFMLSMPAAQVAEVMGRTPDAVRQLQVRALRALRDEYQKMGGVR